MSSKSDTPASAINSKAYKKRFDEFMDEIIKPKSKKQESVET